ncbi:MAG TPA: glycosyltransferase [Rhizomicrobium sp.]|nr:glycosyltransferase [Rhizomicrobium sp.]
MASTAFATLKTPPKPLKICFISEPLDAGVGRHVVEAGCELANRGHEVHVLYSPLRLDPHFLATIQRQSSMRCHAIAMPRSIGPADIPAFLRIRKYVAEHGPFDIVHGQSSKGGGYARLLKLAGLAKTVLYTPHAFITLSPAVPSAKRLLYHAIELLLAPLTAAIICSSQVEQKHGAGLGISPHKLTVIANGSAAAPLAGRQESRAALGLPADAVVVGFIGRMEDQKAPQYLIDAALPLLPELPQLHLLMIGDGSKRRLLENRVRDAGLADRVSWLGAVNAREFTAAMDIFALSSLYEGFAYVLIEALHAGLPIVSTPVGGSEESIMPGENGLIVPHGSPALMAAALRQLVSDPELRRAMAQASATRASRFTIAGMVDAIESLYRGKTANAAYSDSSQLAAASIGVAGEKARG